MTASNLHIFRASRLEELLGPLAHLLEAERPAHVLAPQMVVAAHPGMRPWLYRQLAALQGQGGVLANVQVKLASAWLDELTQQLLGQRATALPKYRRQHLRWSIDALLRQAQQQGISSAQALHYLQQGEAAGDANTEPSLSADEQALRRFQLADRLASVFAQYMIYRPDWLSAWQQGRHTATPAGHALRSLECELLAPLWQRVQAQLGDYRSALMQQLQEALSKHEGELQPLHAFGLAHLPPQELELLGHYARKAPVYLYVPDPCREYWGGLHKNDAAAAQAWANFRAEEAERLADGGSAVAEQGHPLLAQWGRMGQHFFAQLLELNPHTDIRHGLDEAPEAAPQVTGRLQRLQQSLRELQPELLQEAALPQAERRADASLRIHACHTRLRELEVLRDALLDALSRGIQPDQMVVMAPQIAAYAPLLPAVLGRDSLRRLLPYRLADLPQAGEHVLLQALATLLSLGSSRLGLGQVQQLLRTPALARQLQLQPAEAEALCQALAQHFVAWGLDGPHKASLGLPARSEYSLAWGLDRMLAAHVVGGPEAGSPPSALHLPDGAVLLPAEDGAQAPAHAIGALDRLLQQLRAWQQLGQEERSGPAWAALLRERLLALFGPDVGQSPDEEEAQAWQAIERALAQLEAEPEHNRQPEQDAPLLRLVVVRQLLEESLAALPQQQRFMGGGITICGMVPQRAIPFEFVAVLGLNEGEFPRRRPDGGIDLMSQLRRIGDRDEPTDDRYLFLETLMSARQMLYLSYIGRGVQDDQPRNPAAPLAELLAELQRQSPAAAADTAVQAQPWLVQHPLQAFDARYFDGHDAALYSYSAAWAQLDAGAAAQGPLPPLPGLRQGPPLAAAELPPELALSDVLQWCKAPAQSLLRQHLGVGLQALDAHAQAEEDEPLDGLPAIARVALRLLQEQALPAWLATGADPAAIEGLPLQRPDWLQHSGLLPLGAAGEAAWQTQTEQVRALLQSAAGQSFWPSLQAQQHSLAFALHLRSPLAAEGHLQLQVQLHGLHRFSDAGTGQACWLLLRPYPGKKSKDLGLKERLPAFVQWLCLRLSRPAHEGVRLYEWTADGSTWGQAMNAFDRRYSQASLSARRPMSADLEQRLLQLLQHYQRALQGQSLYHPKTASALLLAWQEAGQPPPDGPEAAALLRSDKVLAAWAGTQNSKGERDYSPPYARLLEGSMVFAQTNSQEATAALLQEAVALQRLMQWPEPPAPADASVEGHSHKEDA